MVEVKDLVKELNLKVIGGSNGLENRIHCPDIIRPGLELTGYFEYYEFSRIVVFGNGEINFLKHLSPDIMKLRIRQLLYFNIPCMIISRGNLADNIFIELADQFNVPLLVSEETTSTLINSVVSYLKTFFSPTCMKHGSLVEVYGVGILILGESGVGKSECALELVKRGHRLIVDDIVNIVKKDYKTLLGKTDDLIKHHMEIRGIGIIDVELLFGIGSVADKKTIDLVIYFEEWKFEKEYDRIGTSNEEIEILNVKVPKIVVPIRPGRNLAIILEVAAMNHHLKSLGYNSAKLFTQRIQEKIRKETL